MQLNKIYVIWIKNGNLECKKFNIDEDKVYFEGSYKKNI